MRMKEHGLDLADLSLGFNTDDIADPSSFGEVGFMNPLAVRVKREVGLPVACSWNLGVPQNADQAPWSPSTHPGPCATACSTSCCWADPRCRTPTGRSGRRASWATPTRSPSYRTTGRTG